MTAIYDPPEKIRADMNEIATVRQHHQDLDRATIASALVETPRPPAPTVAGRPQTCPCIVCRVQERKRLFAQHEAHSIAAASFGRSTMTAMEEGFDAGHWARFAARHAAYALDIGARIFN